MRQLHAAGFWRVPRKGGQKAAFGRGEADPQQEGREGVERGGMQDCNREA